MISKANFIARILTKIFLAFSLAKALDSEGILLLLIYYLAISYVVYVFECITKMIKIIKFVLQKYKSNNNSNPSVQEIESYILNHGDELKDEFIYKLKDDYRDEDWGDK